MKCRICDEYFIHETTFKDMFEFKDICDSCKEKFVVSPQVETYPFSGGRLDHIYLLPGLNVNAKQRDYLSKNMKYFFSEIAGKRLKYAILLFIDDREFNTFPEWFPYLKPFQSICLMSLTRCDFDGFMNFF